MSQWSVSLNMNFDFFFKEQGVKLMYAHEFETHKTLCNSKHGSKEYKKAMDKCIKEYNKSTQPSVLYNNLTYKLTLN